MEYQKRAINIKKGSILSRKDNLQVKNRGSFQWDNVEYN